MRTAAELLSYDGDARRPGAETGRERRSTRGAVRTAQARDGRGGGRSQHAISRRAPGPLHS